LNSCEGDTQCYRQRRIDIAAAFFIEQEFQRTGSFIFRLYKSSLGRQVTYSEFTVDKSVIQEGPQLEQTKLALSRSFVERAEFVQRYQLNTSADSFVDGLLATLAQAGVDVSGARSSLIATYNTGTSMNESRAFVVKELADNSVLIQALYNQSFVLTEYF